MAKISKETQARNAKQQAEKTAKSKAVKANARKKVADATKDVEKGKVIPVNQQAGTDKPSFDTSIPLASSGYAEGTEANKATERVLVATDQQRDFVNKLADSKSIMAELVKLGNEVEGMQWKIACFATAIAKKVQVEREDGVFVANEFISQLQRFGKGLSGVRVTVIRDWLLKYAALDWDNPSEGEAKCFIFSKQKHQQFGGDMRGDRFIDKRLAKPFWLMKKEPDLQDFNFEQALKALLNRAQKADSEPEKFKSVNLKGYENFLKQIGKAEPDTAESDQTDQGEQAPAKAA